MGTDMERGYTDTWNGNTHREGTYTKLGLMQKHELGVNIERGHTWSGDIYKEGTYTKMGYIWGFDKHNDRIHTEMGYIQRGDTYRYMK